MLRLLDAENAELLEVQRFLFLQAIEIPEKNGIETEAMVNDFGRAVNQTDSLDAETQESWINFWQQIFQIFLLIGEIRNNPRMMELNEELETYETFREIYEEANDLFESLPSRQDRSDIQMAEWKEKWKQILRKFLEVLIKKSVS